MRQPLLAASGRRRQGSEQGCRQYRSAPAEESSEGRGSGSCAAAWSPSNQPKHPGAAAKWTRFSDLNCEASKESALIHNRCKTVDTWTWGVKKIPKNRFGWCLQKECKRENHCSASPQLLRISGLLFY